MTPILTIDKAEKHFRKVRALDDVSLSVSPGERVALLGHNGAGKTTLFRLILGFIKPDRGRLRVAAQAAGSNVARQAIAYLPENVAFQKSLTGHETIALFARLKGAASKEAAGALQRVGLGPAAARRVGTYSKGMRQRLGLAQALIGAPQLLLLDEPMSGLDPLSKRDFFGFFDELAAAGTAVLFSSHGLSEVAGKSDRIIILRSGRVVADGPLSILQTQAALPINIRVTMKTRADELAARLGGKRVNGEAVEVVCAANEKLEKIRMVTAFDGQVSDIEIRQPSLDDIYHYFSTRPEPL